MGWYAKPSGGYSIDSVEGKTNISIINNYFNERKYELGAQAGLIGNITREGVLNPWKWENDTVDDSRGYGLVQFTPARQYFNQCSDFYYFAPNMSKTEITEGASPNDGFAQLRAIHEERPRKWSTYHWKDEWDRTEWEHLYNKVQDAVSKWGTGGKVTWKQFQRIQSAEDAAILFLVSYEKPNVPNYGERVANAKRVLKLLKPYSTSLIFKLKPLWWNERGD